MYAVLFEVVPKAEGKAEYSPPSPDQPRKNKDGRDGDFSEAYREFYSKVRGHSSFTPISVNPEYSNDGSMFCPVLTDL